MQRIWIFETPNYLTEHRSLIVKHIRCFGTRKGPFMRTLTHSLLALAALSVVSLSTLNAQEIASNSGDATAASIPSTANSVKPWHETELPEDKLISAKVKDGVLVIDGLVAKVQLNYKINNAGYLYFFVPGFGTAIVSRVQMNNSLKVKNAFNGDKLAFAIGGHSFELTSSSALLGGEMNKKGNGEKEDAYVWLDPRAYALDSFPMMGFGTTTQFPYTWPLSAPEPKDTYAHFVTPPPVPRSMLPRTKPTPQPVHMTTMASTGQ